MKCYNKGIHKLSVSCCATLLSEMGAMLSYHIRTCTCEHNKWSWTTTRESQVLVLGWVHWRVTVRSCNNADATLCAFLSTQV